MTTQRRLEDGGTGAVQCPPRGTRIPVEVCAACQWLLDVAWHDGDATVRCAPPAGRFPTERDLVRA
jgi:hypothetical protein